VFLRFEVALRWSGLIGLACGTSHERGKVIVRESSAGRRRGDLFRNRQVRARLTKLYTDPRYEILLRKIGSPPAVTSRIPDSTPQ
jgi:hypothetical protein